MHAHINGIFVPGQSLSQLTAKLLAGIATGVPACPGDVWLVQVCAAGVPACPGDVWLVQVCAAA